MDDKAWNTSNKIFLPNGEEITVDGPITSIEVSNAVKSVGILKFIAKDSDGRPLKPIDFPISCDVITEEYNEAK